MADPGSLVSHWNEGSSSTTGNHGRRQGLQKENLNSSSLSELDSIPVNSKLGHESQSTATKGQKHGRKVLNNRKKKLTGNSNYR